MEGLMEFKYLNSKLDYKQFFYIDEEILLKNSLVIAYIPTSLIFLNYIVCNLLNLILHFFKAFCVNALHLKNGSKILKLCKIIQQYFWNSSKQSFFST